MKLEFSAFTQCFLQENSLKYFKNTKIIEEQLL